MTADETTRLAEIRAREEKATKGPLEARGGGAVIDQEKVPPHIVKVDRDDKDRRRISFIASCFTSKADCEFFAHAREDVPWLLSLVASQQQRIGELEDQLAQTECDLHDAVKQIPNRLGI